MTTGQDVAAGSSTSVVSGGPHYLTQLLAGATIDVRANACFALLVATSGGVCDSSNEPAGTIAATITISQTGVTWILPPQTLTLASGAYIAITGSNDSILCQTDFDCIINAATNGSAGTFNVSGTGNKIVGVQSVGGLQADQVGIEWQVTGTNNVIERNWIKQSGSFGLVATNCISCEISRNHIEQARNACIQVNGTNGLASTTNTKVYGNVGLECNTADTGDSGIAINSSGGVGNTRNTIVQSNTLRYMTGLSQNTASQVAVTAAESGSTVTLTAGANFSAAFVAGTTANPTVINVASCSVSDYDGTFALASGGSGTTALTYNHPFASGLGAATGCTVTLQQTGTRAAANCNGDVTGSLALPITSSVWSGGVVTMTSNGWITAPNLLLVGTTPMVVVSGATPSGMNGPQVVTASTGTTFSFAYASSGTVTGTVTVQVAGHGSQASGCSEGIQVTDNPQDSLITDNFVYGSYREGMVIAGSGNREIGNHCDGCGNYGTGVGAFMWSNTTLTGVLGNGEISDNVATNHTPFQTGYGISVNNGSSAGAWTTFTLREFSGIKQPGAMATSRPS